MKEFDNTFQPAKVQAVSIGRTKKKTKSQSKPQSNPQKEEKLKYIINDEDILSNMAAALSVQMGSVGGFEEVFRQNNSLPGKDEQFISTNHLSLYRKRKSGKLKVAAYIRVSTENPKQQDSYETQERYFSNLLANNPDWVSAGIYSDYGISATSDRRRVGFQRILRHCREGKIDRIVCKSISRFARNTSDFLTALQVLREYRVTIFFERENLDTADPTSDFILTTLGAIAQEESRSISENIRWGFNKRYPRGEAKNYVIYGYRYVEGEEAWEVLESGYRRKRIEIVEEEAEVVRRIFQMVANGETYKTIARILNHEGIPAPRSNWRKNGKQIKKGELKEGIEPGWTANRISSMVRMERYTGDVILQKVFTQDFLSHKVLKNNGELPQYYVENNHPAIISRELFWEVQKIVEMNSVHNQNVGERQQYPFSQRIICGRCGRFLHSRNRQNHPIWHCPSASLNNGRNICSAERIYEEQLIRVMRKAIIERFELINTMLYDDIRLADIFNGKHLMDMYGSISEEYDFAECFDSFVEQMRARLEYVQRMDCIERDRAFLRRRILMVQTEKDSIISKNRLLQSRVNMMMVRKEVLGDTEVDVPELEKLKLDMEAGNARLFFFKNEEKALFDKLTALEEYWKELEQDYEWRDKAIEWMKGLPMGREGTLQFLNGLTDVYVKGFVLSITVYSPQKYSIHWFDDTRTEVTMDSNIEDYRYADMYWNGYKMCRNPRYKPGRK